MKPLGAPIALVLLALGAGVSACGREEPRWIPLAAAPAVLTPPPAAPPDAGAARIVQTDGEAWIETEIPRGEWHRMEHTGRWRATPPLRSPGRGVASRARLTSGERAFVQQRAGGERSPRGTPGTFALIGEWLVLQLAEDEEPPERVTFALHSAREPRKDGVAHVNGRRFSGTGFSVWPGERLELALDVPPASVLRVALSAEALQRNAEPRAYRFRIRLDGDVLLDHELAEAPDGAFARFALPLPPGGRSGGKLAFEVGGPLGMTAFLEPVVAPLAPPADAPRAPDLVLFVADTFRADNLAAYGGPEGLTPNLDALARESLRFAEMRSVATHTGPAHGSLLSGQYPTRLALDVFGNSLPEEVVTIAEALARAGYRTGAVTDSGIVSRSFGLSQGFQWFDELNEGMASTEARVRSFLESGDGRPTFLFVHTYRVHAPYVSTSETRARLAPLLGPDPLGETQDFSRELQDVLDPRAGAPHALDEHVRELAARYRARYLAGVAEFDQELGALLAEPRLHEMLARGYLLFTSDHGEAFLEHGEIHHSGRVYEEQIRVPLLLRGPGIAPGARDEPVSLIDVTPTLADLAGLPVSADWQGRSLRVPAAPRPYLYAFECNVDRPATMAVFSSGHELMALLDQRARRFVEPYAAFDLARDPAQRNDLLGDAAWPAELYAHLEAHRAELLEPLLQGAAAELDAEQRGDLEALGYGGAGREH